jgi:hypothetical protein
MITTLGDAGKTSAVGEQSPVLCAAAEERLGGLGPAEVEVQVVFPGEGDTAVNLDGRANTAMGVWSENSLDRSVVVAVYGQPS